MSLYYSNGTFIDLAKIEGGSAYKAYMLGTHDSLDSSSMNVAIYCPFPPQICQYWPLQAKRNPLAPMFRALFAKGDATLESTSLTAAVATFTYNMQSLEANVRSSLTRLNVDGRGRLENVGRSIVMTIGIQGKCTGTFVQDPDYHEDPAQLVLSAEYTRHSMTAYLWEEHCGDLEVLKPFSSGQVGHDAISACRQAGGDGEGCMEALKDALRQATLTPKRSQFRPNEEIGAVLVFGEEADDDFLATALRDFLEERYPNGASVEINHARELSPHPAFAGARSMAMADLRMKETEAEWERTRQSSREL